MKFAATPIRQYAPHLRHVTTLPWEIKDSNFLQIFYSLYKTCYSNLSVMQMLWHPI